MRNRIWLLLWLGAGLLCLASNGWAQGGDSRSEKPKPPPVAVPPKPPAGPKPAKTPARGPVRPPQPPRPTPTAVPPRVPASTPNRPTVIFVPVPVEPTPYVPPVEPPPCKESHLVVRCGLPGCEVWVDKEKEGSTAANGELHLTVSRGTHTVSVSKSGYERRQQTLNVGCGEGEAANLFLATKPYQLRVRTNLPHCDVFLNNGATSAGQTDAQGFLTLSVSEVQVMVQARKYGYLAASANVTPDTARYEVSLSLLSVPARLYLSVNAPKAQARMDGQGEWLDVGEPLTLTPGPHSVTVQALGFTPATLSLTPQPNEKLDREVVLTRLPVPELLAAAEQFLTQCKWGDLQTLCRFVWEVEPDNAAAHRLSGLAYLENQDYAQAEPHLRQALRGGASFRVPVRRHAQEKFELSKGHDACFGWLTLAPDSLEYRGQTVTTENFRVTKASIQIAGLQIKKDTALCLGLKIADEKGKRREYNFFSPEPEKELNSAGKPYLEMLQRLLAAL